MARRDKWKFGMNNFVMLSRHLGFYLDKLKLRLRNRTFCFAVQMRWGFQDSEDLAVDDAGDRPHSAGNGNSHTRRIKIRQTRTVAGECIRHVNDSKVSRFSLTCFRDL